MAIENANEVIAKNRAEWQRVVQVDEEKGTITELDDVYGRFLAVDPKGKYLYTGFKDIYTKGLTFHINPDDRIVTFPKYGNIDILLRYRLKGGKVELDEHLWDAGGNGNGLALAPDGAQIAYLSVGGTPSLSFNLAVLRNTNFKEGAVTLETKGKASCKSLTYHPLLPLVACLKGDGALCFDSKTGAESPNRLKLTALGLGKAKVEDLVFSSDGKHLVFVLSEPGHPWQLKSVPLNLSEEEAAKVKAASK